MARYIEVWVKKMKAQYILLFNKTRFIYHLHYLVISRGRAIEV